MITASGVRSSWETVATNSSLARAAACWWRLAQREDPAHERAVARRNGRRAPHERAAGVDDGELADVLALRIERNGLQEPVVLGRRRDELGERRDPVPDAALADEPDVLPERVHRGVREEHLTVDVRHQDPVGRRVEDGLALGQQPLALRLRRVPFGDVDDRAEVAGDRAVLGVERDGAARDPRDRLVPPQEAELDRELDAAERERRPRVRDVAGVLGVDRLAPPVPERLVARQAAQLLPLVVDEDAPAVRVGRVDADGGARDECPR